MGRLLSALTGWKGYALVAVTALTLGAASGWTVRDWKARADSAADQISAVEARRVAVANALRIERAQAAITSDVDATATEAQVQIRTITQTHIKEAPVYVPAEADLRFVLPVGLVRVHDAAAAGRPLSDPAGQPDGPAGNLDPSDVAPSRLAAVIAENYGVCHLDQARLASLQDWVRRQGELVNSP